MAYDEEYEDIEEKKESYMKNQAKSMAKDAGKKVAREAKKATKEALKQALKALFKLIGWKGLLIVGIVLAVIVILVAICAHIEIKDGSKDEGNPGNVPYVVSEAIRNSTVIKDENGNYSIGFTFEEDGKKTVLNYDESIDKIFKTLKENGDVLLQYLSEDVEKQKEYIKMFIEAEVATTYPKLGDSGLQGKIKIIRKTDDGKNIELKYIGKDEFDEKIKNGDTNIQNYFTLDENGALIVSSKEIINLKEIENGKTISDTTTVNITSSNPNNYKTSLRKYTLPFDYLWAMLVKTNDLQFMREISSLAKESEINIDIMEEKRITTSIVEKEHTVANIQKDEAYITVSFSDSSVETRYIDTDEYVINSSIYNYKNITTTEQIIPNIAVTYARTWIADYTNTYPESKIKSEFGSEDVELKNTGKKEQYSNAIKSDNTEKWYADQIWNNNVKSIKENWNKKIKYTKEDEFKEGSSTYTVEYKYGTPTSKLVEKTDKNSEEKNAVTLLVNSKNALETLKETGDWLYEMLDGNENADYMIDITKYLLYKATGKDYGVKELNLDKLEIIDTNMGNGSINILEDYIASWENENMFRYLSGETSEEEWEKDPFLYNYITKDKKFYICYTDYGLDNGTRNYGFGVCHYDPTCGYMQVNSYSKQGIDITGVKGDLGAQLEVEIVNNVKKEIINNMKSDVKNETSGLDLTENQINALTAVRYQYGNIGNFVEVYQKYGNTEALRNEFKTYNNNGVLYGQPWSKDEEWTRKESTWIVFSEGKYFSRNKRELIPSSGSDVVNYALQFVGETHERFTSYRTTDGNTFIVADWCAMFVSYCFDNCSLIPNKLPISSTSCTTILRNLESKNKYKDSRSGYIPVPGDVIFFDWDYERSEAEHIGIVVSCDGTTVYTVEGNNYGADNSYYTSTVKERQYNINYENILGYGTVAE